MVDQQLLHRMLSQFARTLVQRFAVADVLYELNERVLAVVGVEGAGVSVDDGTGRLRFASAINEASAQLERIQEDAQRGPCVDAFTTGEPVIVGTLDGERARWPEFVDEALAAGFHAVAAIPMRLDGTRLGALNLYRMRPHEWADDEVEAAELFASMATGYVANATELERSRATVAQLEEALESRVIIEQAKGIIAAERDISVDEAFNDLRAHARSHGANLREVAEAVVRLGLRP